MPILFAFVVVLFCLCYMIAMVPRFRVVAIVLVSVPLGLLALLVGSALFISVFELATTGTFGG